MKKVGYKIMMFISMITNKKKSYYYLNNYYYDTLLDKYRNGKYYGNLINKLKNNNKIKSDAEIRLVEDKKLSEIGVKDIIKKHGKPYYKFIHEDLHKINILFYRRKLVNHKVKKEYHFFKGNLFLYSYTFSYLNLEEKSEMIRIISEKYLKGGSVDFKNDYIIDKSNNVILLNNNNLAFSIYYLCDIKMAFENILEYIDFKKFEVERRDEHYRKRLFKKL